MPIGIMLLDSIDSETLRLCIAALLIFYGGYFSFRAALPAIQKPMPKVDVSVGLIGGVLGGVSGVSGAIPAMWLSMRPWSKGQIRAVLQPFNMLILSVTITLLFFKGACDATTRDALMDTLPIA